MTEQVEKLFVPYNLAVKLKEKGFQEPCLGGYSNSQKINITRVSFQSDLDGFCLAPTYQQVVDWFREERGIHIEVFFENPTAYSFELLKRGVATNESPYPPKHTYYQAMDAAIEEATKLIPNE